MSDVALSADGAGASASVAWDGHVFLEIAGTELSEATGAAARPRRPLLHRRYVPSVGEWGKADID